MSIERRRIRYVAFAIATATLGLSGVLGESCGGSDSAPATDGAAGNGGSGGSGGSSGMTTGGGFAGKATGATATTGTTGITGMGGGAGSGAAGSSSAGGAGGKAGSGGMGGSSGSGGKGGSAGAGGSAGKAGAAGAAGSAGKAGSGGAGGMDAGPVDGSVDAADADVTNVCRAFRIDAGSTCLDSCTCDQCAPSAVACFANPGCRALLECAQSHGCADTVCVFTMCQGQIADAGGSSIAAANTFAACYFNRCSSMCNPDASSNDASSGGGG